MFDSAQNLLRDRYELERAQIQALLVQMTLASAYGKTMDQLVAEELIKIRAARIEKDAADAAEAAYAAAWQRGILNASPPAKLALHYEVPEQKQTAEQRREARYKFCVARGLQFPDTLFGRMPNGIKGAAAALGITRQSLAADIKAHILTLSKNGR